MTKKVICDRCGKIIDDSYAIIDYAFCDDAGKRRNYHNEDICKNCYSDFEKFMAGENVITNELAVE